MGGRGNAWNSTTMVCTLMMPGRGNRWGSNLMAGRGNGWGSNLTPGRGNLRGCTTVRTTLPCYSGLLVQEITIFVHQPFGRKFYAEGMNEAKIIHDLGTQIGRTNFEPTGLLMSPGLTILLKKS
jgi:hypothetical protein